MIVALFHREAALVNALEQLRAARIGPIGTYTVETYTPAPLQDADTASPIPIIILLAGLLGVAASFGLQTYSYTVAYPFHIGGRPDFAWASFIPNAFENAVLIAVAAGFVAYFAINRMPRLYEPVDEASSMRSASRDGWVVSVQSEEPALLDRARTVLRDAQAARIEEVPS